MRECPAVRTTKHILVIFIAVLLYHCIGTWPYLRHRYEFDFGYIGIGGSVSAMITDVSVFLAGVGVFATAVTSLDE